MRIGYLALGYPPALGGAELYNGELSQRLVEAGHEVRALVWSPSEDRSTDPLWVTRLPVGAGGLDPLQVRRRFADWRPDVFFASRGSRRLARVLAEAARLAPLVVNLHELRDRHTERGPIGKRRVRRRYALDSARLVVVSSEHTARRVEAIGVPPERVRCVLPGTRLGALPPDTETRDQARRSLGLGGGPMLLTVARLAANKGHDRVLRVLPSLRRRVPGVRYLVVGDGAERARLETLAGELGVASAVHFVGEVENVEPYLRSSDVFVLPTRLEGFGIATLEAAASGCAVVTTPTGGGDEIVVDGETGLLVPIDDETRLEQAIAALLADPGRAREMGRRGWERAQRFSWSEASRRLEAVLREAASPAPPPRRGGAHGFEPRPLDASPGRRAAIR